MRKINISLYYVFSVHILALLFMFLLRLVLLFTNLQHLESSDGSLSFVFSALLHGLWFDNVIASYISALPLVILSIAGLLNRLEKILFRMFDIFYIVVYTLVFAIGSADIPYFNYFFKHLNSSIFNWKEEGATNAGMILEEPSYYAYFAIFLILTILFSYLVLKISRYFYRKPQENIRGKQYTCYVITCLLLFGVCFLGIRGRVKHRSIKTSQAYFCTNSFLNQLGLNPLFFFMRDYIDNSKEHYSVDNLISEDEAISNVRTYLGLTGAYDKLQSPIERQIVDSVVPKNMNVVFILMESMSANFLKIQENGKSITPYLNSLIDKSYYFDNFYSAGNHTNQGILATLYGFPSLLDKNMMKNVYIPLYQGMPSILADKGYRTLFFMTHEGQYDNLNGFLFENGVQEIYSEEDYPEEKIVNNFGVADDYLFEYGFAKLNEESRANQPFFATLLTISNHPPYTVPEKYKLVSSNVQHQTVAFADDAIRDFMEKAATTEWYDNTIFVLLGDHGRLVGSQIYDMPLSYNHIPLIIYSPAFKDSPKRFHQFGGQVDVFPTILGLLNQSYTNNTLGIDLFKGERPYMFFSSDDSVGAIDSTFFYFDNVKTSIEGLFKYRDNNPKSQIAENRAKADSMKRYSVSMLRVSDYMTKNKLTRVNKKD